VPAEYPPSGGGGGGSAPFTFIQAVPSATWVIVHGLGYKPNVTVVDSTERQVEGDVQYNSLVQITITFSAAFAGEAYLS
jgi:hypothetical protein